MKSIRRAFCLALALALCLAVFSGCSRSSGQSESPSGGVSGSDGVHKLKILGPDPGNQYIKYSEREEYKVWELLQEMLAENGLELEIEAVPNDQYEVVIQTRMSAATDLPDIANLTPLDDATILSLGKQGTIQELGSLIQQYSNGNIDRMYGEVYDTGYPLIKTADDRIYWLTNLHMNRYGDKEAGMGLGLQIRQDWLDRCNLAMPTTLDQFTEALQTFRAQDVNGSGKEDEILLLDLQGFQNGLAQTFGLVPGLVGLDVVNDKIVSPWYQDNIQAYFQYVLSLVEEGLIDPATVGSPDLQNQRIAENMVSSWYAYDSATYLNDYVTSVDDADYEPVFTLTAVEGTSPIKEMETAQLVWERYVITKACTDLEGAIKFFDMIYSDEYTDILHWGVEGETYEIRDGEKVKLEIGSNEDKANARKTEGSPLWGGLLPRVQMGSFQANLDDVKKSDRQREVMLEAIDYENWSPMMLNNFLAMPTEEETERINAITTGLTTYSEEMATKICLGQMSLDQFDDYLAELKELGLDELLEIQQARYDRFKASME